MKKTKLTNAAEIETNTSHMNTRVGKVFNKTLFYF